MELVIVRHGAAEDLGGKVRRDADRALTAEGRRRTLHPNIFGVARM